MKHRIIAIAIAFGIFALGLVVGAAVTGYVYSPGGELIAKGKVTYHNVFSSGRAVVTINGVTYTTRISNVVIMEKPNE